MRQCDIGKRVKLSYGGDMFVKGRLARVETTTTADGTSTRYKVTGYGAWFTRCELLPEVWEPPVLGDFAAILNGEQLPIARFTNDRSGEAIWYTGKLKGFRLSDSGIVYIYDGGEAELCEVLR